MLFYIFDRLTGILFSASLLNYKFNLKSSDYLFHFLNSKAIHFFSSAPLSQIHYKQMGGRDLLRNLSVASSGKTFT